MLRLFFLLIFYSTTSHSLSSTLDNGLKTIVQRKEGKLCALQAWVSSGSIYEEEWTGSGISHLIEHLLFKEADGRKIANEIEAVGGDVSAYTTYDKTVYKVEVQKPYIDLSLSLLTSALFSPSFQEKDIETEKEVILSEIDRRDDDPESFLQRKLFFSAYITHPSRYPIIGYRELFTNLARGDIVSYHKRMYIPENITIVAVGDFNEREMEERIRKAFSKIERSCAKPLALIDEPQHIATRRFCEEKEGLNMCYLNIGFQIPDITSPDLYPLDLLAELLGGGRGNRLSLALEEKGLVHSISAYSWTPAWKGLFGISAITPQERLKEAKEAIFGEIERIKNNGVTDQELLLAKKKIQAGLLFQRETPEGLASDLASSFLTTGDPDYSERYLTQIKTVTQERIKEVAQRYLSRSNMTEALLSPPSLVQEEASIPKEYKVERYKLKNGLTLLLKPYPDSKILSIHAAFLAGRRVEEEGKEGISNLLANLLLKGTSEKSYKEILDIIESYGGSIASFSGRNSLGISISTLSEGEDTAIGILSEILRKPAISLDELKKEKEKVLMRISAKEDDSFSSSFKLLLETLFTKHPYRILEEGRKESIQQITREDVLSFYSDWVRPNNLVISIFGDIDKDTTLSAIKANFEDWQVREIPQVVVHKEPPVEQERVREEKRDFKESTVIIGFLGTTVTNQDRYQLELLSNILSRQGGRLFSALREEEGLSYSCGAFNIFGVDPGAFIIYAGTKESNVERVISRIKDQIRDICENGVGEEELKEAKNCLLGQKLSEQERQASYGFNSCLYELYGIGAEEQDRLLERIDQITPDSLKAEASSYLDLNRCAIVILKGSGTLAK
ncbi:MAG: pitrilysin family protein [bacterium]